MEQDFLAEFMGNASRARLLRLFVLSEGDAFTLAHLVKRSQLSAGVVKKELQILEKSGLVKKTPFAIRVGKERLVSGTQKEVLWSFGAEGTYASAVSRFVHVVSPVKHDIVLEKLRGSGKLVVVVLSGGFVGDKTRPVDLLIVADALNEKRLERAVQALEPVYGREIRYTVFTTPEFRYRMTIQDRLIRDTLDYPHIVLMDRMHLL